MRFDAAVDVTGANYAKVKRQSGRLHLGTLLADHFLSNLVLDANIAERDIVPPSAMELECKQSFVGHRGEIVIDER